MLPEFRLTIRTTVEGPYDNEIGHGDLLLYAYRGKDPEHRENRSLCQATRHQIPLIYVLGVLEGRYLPVWPVFVVNDDRGGLHFTITGDDNRSSGIHDLVASEATGISYSAEAALRRR